MPIIDTRVLSNSWYYQLLKPKIVIFINSIKDAKVREGIVANLKKVYLLF